MKKNALTLTPAKPLVSIRKEGRENSYLVAGRGMAGKAVE